MHAGMRKTVHIFTIGHSNRHMEDFIGLLRHFGIQLLADVRRYPSSRKFPHFNREALQRRLDKEGIGYDWFESLGGFRHRPPKKASPNTGLESPGFRNYADYMLTDAFQQAVEKLLAFTADHPAAIMCAEKLYWKCHRRLLSDCLTTRGVKVEHIIERNVCRSHVLTPGAVVREPGRIVYPGQPELFTTATG